MVKLIVFDLDGVLVDAKKIHYESLNIALGNIDKKFLISWDEHLNKYDGLKTNQKLKMLSLEKGLPIEFFEKIWEEKQNITLKLLKGLKPNDVLVKTISKLVNDGYKIACCSNSIKKTVITVLHKLNIIEYFDVIISNQDVENSKPHPEMYWKAISKLNCLPDETLIVEDSPFGLQAAFRSNSHILRVNSPNDVTYYNIKNKINEINKKINICYLNGLIKK